MQNDKNNIFSNDISKGEGPAVLRENARLNSENTILKKRVFRGITQNIILGILFAIFIFSFLSIYPKYRYIPTLDNNAICEVYSNAESNITVAALTEYASDAIVDLNTYDYVNYQESINRSAGKWLSENGRKSFLKTLDDSGNLERVKKGKLILRSTKISAAQIEEDGKLENGQHYWLVQVPIMIEFYVGGEDRPTSRQDFLAAVTIVKNEPSASNKKGISADRINLTPYSGLRR